VTEDTLIAFAERLLILLDQGTKVATYKYAVLLALMDLCLEKSRRDGSAPDSVTTRQLAEKVIELYWPQTVDYDGRTLRQNSGTQARVVADIHAVRAALEDPTVSLFRARAEAPERMEDLIRKVEWTLILMPLPRLQVVGGGTDRLLYEIAWDVDIGRDKRAVTRYQSGHEGAFDNNIRLLPGVGDHLVLLSGMLRPLIHRAWSGMVARFNGLQESRLEEFLFGVDRVGLSAIRSPLVEIQRGVCLYCGGRLGPRAQVDHFIPWSRYPDDGIHNLVAADERCNRDKRDFLAAPRHVITWRQRNTDRALLLERAAAQARWESHPEETLSVARGIYLRLPARARLWVKAGEFCLVGAGPLGSALA
jgi:hypothetical protein